MTEDQMIAALNEIDARKASLPERCPSWCTNDHIQAIDEGCDVAAARVHRSGDHVPVKGLRVELTQDHVTRSWAPVEIGIEVQGSDAGLGRRVELKISTAEARSLAATLIHLADADELRR